MKEPSMVKGYVVRGFQGSGPVHAVRDGWVYYGVVPPARFDSIDDAAEVRAPMIRGGCHDVRIFAVDKDGSETALPTYEEALAILNETRAQTCTPMSLEKLPAFMQRALSESIDVADMLHRIVVAWREDEIGQVDGALIEEAETLLGIEAEPDPLAVGS